MAKRRNSRKRTRREPESPLADKPFRHLTNPLSPVELLKPEQLNRLHNASVHILEEIGIDFLDEEALDLWQAAGARVDHQSQHVWMDRELISSLVAKAPAEFTLFARNPEYSLQIGGNHIRPAAGNPG